MTASKDFDVSSSGSDVLYFRGHPSYDAIRVEFDGASGSADTDVTYRVSENDFENVNGTSFGSVGYQVGSSTALDPSSGAHDGEVSLARTVAIEINEQGGVGNAAGTVYLHNSSEEAQNAHAFANK